MYTVSVRSHVMIAHSFRGELFGPAQRLHGATYVVDVEFRRPELGAEGVVIDIGRASDALGEVLGQISYRNLDEVPAFTGKNTTTEFLSRFVFDQIAARLRSGALGSGSKDVTALRVTLHESHVASASFEGPL